MYKVKCLDCDTEMLVDDDYTTGEIISCQSCGVEYEIEIDNNCISIKYLELDGLDYGE
jgi:transcription elongation factor Elf1